MVTMWAPVDKEASVSVLIPGIRAHAAFLYIFHLCPSEVEAPVKHTAVVLAVVQMKRLLRSGCL